MNPIKTITIGDNAYDISRMPARTQFHVWRRLVPLITTMHNLPMLIEMSKEMDAQEKVAVFFAAMGPVAKALAAMPDEDVDYVLNACLSVVSRKQADGRAAPVLAPGGALMFEDIQMTDMVLLAKETIEGNLGNFFDLLQAAVT